MSFLMDLAIKTTNLLSGNRIGASFAQGGGGGSSSSSSGKAQTSEIGQKVNEILHFWVGPIFTVIGAIGAIYIVILAVQYAKSENDNKKAEVKSRIVNCVIGVISLFVITALCFSIDWGELAKVFGYASN